MSAERPTTPDVEKGPSPPEGARPAFSPEETALIFGTGETLDERVEAVHSKVDGLDSEVKEIKTRVGNVEAGLGFKSAPRPPTPQEGGGLESGGAPGGGAARGSSPEESRAAGSSSVESAFDLF